MQFLIGRQSVKKETLPPQRYWFLDVDEPWFSRIPGWPSSSGWDRKSHIFQPRIKWQNSEKRIFNRKKLLSRRSKDLRTTMIFSTLSSTFCFVPWLATRVPCTDMDAPVKMEPDSTYCEVGTHKKKINHWALPSHKQWNVFRWKWLPDHTLLHPNSSHIASLINMNHHLSSNKQTKMEILSVNYIERSRKSRWLRDYLDKCDTALRSKCPDPTHHAEALPDATQALVCSSFHFSYPQLPPEFSNFTSKSILNLLSLSGAERFRNGGAEASPASIGRIRFEKRENPAA